MTAMIVLKRSAPTGCHSPEIKPSQLICGRILLMSPSPPSPLLCLPALGLMSRSGTLNAAPAREGSAQSPAAL